MVKSLLYDAAHWRKRAQQTIAKAQMTWEPESKEKLLKLAAEYMAIARRAELANKLQEHE